ncbi:pyridoxamine 5'-phosphate oxidase family protein [Natranaerobius trueperi]|uniref:Pyridoxamine 5'-phosphate oxidase N-terminal domain-containing protein n=1 Tax=Natranaerobius trueperi TaxID=759412 RepID=A0A226BXD6_9FIRM|nr:pyridoxamine 5'-phosphate oxidase family protein [Natranaerobius trueperi]OWZ82994.1 hypothetical protein CDO51_10865 [Natranaerobius trueperi]
MSHILGSKLTEEHKKLFNEKEVTAVVATVSENGYPNAAPMALFYAPDSKILRMSIGSMHETYKNIKQNGKVVVSVMEDDDIAFSVKGECDIIKEKSDVNDGMAVIEMKVDEVKKDTSPVARITGGVEIEPRNEKSVNFLKGLAEELRG